MPHFRNCTAVCAYRDRSSKGWANGEGKQKYHDCWRVEIYINGQRVRRHRSYATTKAEAIAEFS